MTQIEVPTDLPIILRDFTLSVLRSKPRDIVDHAVQYFTQLRQQSPLIKGDNDGAAVAASHPPAKRNVAFSGECHALARCARRLHARKRIGFDRLTRLPFCHRRHARAIDWRESSHPSADRSSRSAGHRVSVSRDVDVEYLRCTTTTTTRAVDD